MSFNRNCIFLLFAGLSACGSGKSDAPGDTVTGSSNNSDWQLKQSTDPMTDAHVSSATKEFDESPFKIQAKVTCSGRKTLSYSFTAFDEKGEGAELRREAPGDGTRLVTPYSVRLDGQKPADFMDLNGRYSNELLINGGIMGASPDELGRAMSLLIKLPLKAGEVMLKIDQRDQGLQTVLDACAPRVTPPPPPPPPEAAPEIKADEARAIQAMNDLDAAKAPPSSMPADSSTNTTINKTE